MGAAYPLVQAKGQLNLAARKKNATTHMENNIIGTRITDARKKLNLSQAQLAERLFISPQAVGKWERGESFPDIVTVNRLAEILGVDLNYFSGNFPSTATAPTAEEPATKRAANASTDKQGDKLRWDMSRGNWVDADFSGLKDLQEKFGSSNMKNCKFIGSDLSGLLLKNNNMDSCDLSDSDLSGSRIQGSNLLKDVLKGCSLNGAEFSDSNISYCDFTSADLTGATVKGCGFEKNTMLNAVLKRTSFINCYIGDTVFEGTVEDCQFDNCDLTRVTFRNTTLLNTFFKCRSLKKLKFIDCKTDRITYEFLKSGKADLTGVEVVEGVRESAG